MAAATLALRRERRTLDSATLASGAEQVVDFVLPLFAGAILGLSAWETGLLIAASQLTAFLIRPVAGVVVDRADRSVVGALGAGAFAVGCGLFALSTGFSSAVIAAVVTGGAGAFLWVAIRSIIGERLHEDSSVFAKLVAAEETGGWLILVPAIILLSIAGYQWVFAGIALCCLLAAWGLFRTRHRDSSTDDARTAATELSSVSLRRLGTSLRPMLLAVVVTMTAEAAISLLLILHLQRGFGLGVVEIAYVFLPGAIVMSVLPAPLHRLVVRFGRRRMLMLGSVSSALFALGLAFAPSPPWIAALWVLSAVAWAAVIPVQQSVIAEVAGRAHLGCGLSLYEAACLAGAFIGSLVAGLLYESGSWLLACLICALVISSGAALIPAAVRRLGVTDDPEAAAVAALSGPARPTIHSDGRPSTTQDVDLSARSDANESMAQKSRRTLLTDLAAHSGLLAVGLLIARFAVPESSFSSILGFGSEAPGVVRAVRELFGGDPDIAALAGAAMRTWVVVYIIDLIWTAWKMLETRSDDHDRS
ncbi:MFS transporter [Pseudactinotalea sp. HY160]|uniref:MFS transporter n=1 Tax=Pseudactinotalea sp. HY160 TaxID=2654490 RepID=UPI00128D4FAF|nr:MFS transporter [Pseudactinotalea sp. HY160]MPV50232.1 MFS transporter [Pseudactinotalea sp. HY160]